MTLINRIARLCRADAHALIDRLEDQETLLAGAIHDMEAAHAAKCSRAAEVRQRLNRAQSFMEDLAAKTSAAGEELEVCLDAGEEDLARAVIKRRIQYERRMEAQQQSVSELSQSLRALESELSRETEQLEAVREKQSLVVSDDEPADELEPSITREQVEVVLLREKQRRST